MKRTIKVLAITLALIFTSAWTISAAPMVSEGSSCAEVSVIQQELCAKGYFTSEITGYFGEETKDAVLRFQTDSGITADGVVGDETRERLYTAVENLDPEPAAAYSDEDLYWMSRIIYAEAGSEPYEGKVAVGNVIMNRVRSSQFPNTVYGVVFDRRYGVTQFSPVSNGSIYRNPPQDCINAAIDALNGAAPVGGALYFCNPRISSSTWMIRTRPLARVISNHNFYL